MMRRRYVEGYFGPSKHHCLLIPCIHTSCVEICESTRQLISDVDFVLIRMRLHLVHHDGYVDSNEVKAIIVIRGLVVPVAQRKGSWFVCRPEREARPT